MNHPDLYAILVEAHKSSQVDILMGVVQREYPKNQHLREACNEYRIWLKQVGLNFESTIDESAPAPGDSPYKGLRFFDQDDADLFFGRELLTAKLVGHLREHRFLTVVGASGSGKSSVVRAGVIPALKRDAPLADGTRPPDGCTNWVVRVITPKAHPLRELAVALSQDTSRMKSTVLDSLSNNVRSLDLEVRQVLQQTSANRLLLVVDQFEELFTQCRNQKERQAFVDNLLTAAILEENGPTIVILTLRADFYAHCAEFDGLREALAKRQEYIGPMTSGELRQAIEEPAQRTGWAFEAGLVDLLLQDVGDEPGALPLLSHALLETWKRRQGRTLVFEGYTESGRVQGAIARTAETIFNQLETEQQAIARNIFLRLTELGKGTQDTRRRTALTDLIPESDKASDAEKVLTILADARLITTEQENAEVAHEALIREWPLLHTWLNEDREALQTHRRLTDMAKQWANHNQDSGFLYQGVRLAETKEWAKEHGEEMNALERKFLTASQTAQRLSAILKFGGIVAIVTLAIVAFMIYLGRERRVASALERQEIAVTQTAIVERGKATAAFAKQEADAKATIEVQATAESIQRQAAQRQSKISLARQLASQSLTSIETNRSIELSLLLAIESAGASIKAEKSIPQVYQALHQAIIAGPTKFFRHESGVESVVFSPDGSRLATASSDNTARIWDSESGEQLALLQHESGVEFVVFSPDGSRLATASRDNTARIWDSESGEQLALLQHQDIVWSVDFSPDGSRLATASRDNTARIWDSKSGEQLARLQHEGSVLSVVFSSDGSRLATKSDDNTARIWDSESGEQLALLQHEDSVRSVVFSSDGSRLATRSDENTARLWGNLWWQSLNELVLLACHIVSRPLTEREWSTYMPSTETYRSTCSDLPADESTTPTSG
ncbi:WD40 repeat domain-containing protein [Chloroflexi bacterium TSY]|nr:WD40 repeat domain-containing protein [Chloroflexi bacterium TSY]